MDIKTHKHTYDELHTEQSEKYNDILEAELAKINKKGFIRCFDVHHVGEDFHLMVGCELNTKDSQLNKVKSVLSRVARFIGGKYELVKNKAQDGFVLMVCVEK